MNLIKPMSSDYRTKEEVLERANSALEKSLREIIPTSELGDVMTEVAMYESRKKGLFGELVERYVFDIVPNNRSGADFEIAGVELKTNPIKKHPSKTYISKERLVFSMIDYRKVVDEKWENSSFLKKNGLLLLMFYLWMKEKNILDYEFKYVRLLNLLGDISEEDVLQIRKDWEFIVEKIRRGEAHLLSEADTYYLGACTKAANSSVVRDQPNVRIPAKPRAFSLKQQYLNYLIQKNLLGRDIGAESLIRKEKRVESVEDAFMKRLSPYLEKTDSAIKKMVGWEEGSRAKNYKRLLVNKMLGVTSKRIEELEKANITLKVVTLEHTGTLRESVSFPAFDYLVLADEKWEDEQNETMTAFHLALETKKFLFIVFQKVKGSEEVILRKAMFWNFPMSDLPEAERVWETTKSCVKDGRYEDLPKISGSSVAHVRPHGKDGNDKLLTPQGTKEIRRCFWLNAKYIQKALGY